MHPVSVADLMTVSDAGEIMPPKSTWFEPKLRDGLLSHLSRSSLAYGLWSWPWADTDGCVPGRA
jgi:hypothetical protein